MSNEWSLSRLLDGLHDDIAARLERIRASFGHPGAKGDASEGVWLELLGKYLPQRYRVETGFVVDSKGNFSDQIDVMVFDRQYSPFIFEYDGKIIVPAESLYAVFEAKQTINLGLVEYAQGKIASVRNLHRTTLPIPHAGGIYAAKSPLPVLGGILTFGSDWNPPLGESLLKAIETDTAQDTIDLGCVAAHGYFHRVAANGYTVENGGKPATAFLFLLISMLQSLGTVPMMNVLEYSKWLAK